MPRCEAAKQGCTCSHEMHAVFPLLARREQVLADAVSHFAWCGRAVIAHPSSLSDRCCHGGSYGRARQGTI